MENGSNKWIDSTHKKKCRCPLYTWKVFAAAAAAKSLQSCPTPRNPTDGSPLGSSVPGILQARIPEWVAISFSNAWKSKVKVKSLSRARLLATPWTAAYQAPPSMEFSRQECWSGVPLPSPIGELGQSKDVIGLNIDIIWYHLPIFHIYTWIWCFWLHILHDITQIF